MNFHPPFSTRTLRAWAAGLFVASAMGCSGSDGWISETTEGLEQANKLAVRPAVNSLDFTPVLAAEPFSPLNPERRNPFAYGGQLASLVPEAAPSRLAQVRVLGFVTTDQPRVILALDGQPHTLAERETAGAIRVEKIDVPNVTLRSGATSWTASLFDQR